MAKSATENIYSKLAERTGGDIYIGVVGPVRTGKSTFIKRFMELVVIPNIRDPWVVQRAQDELPQSAAGKTSITGKVLSMSLRMVLLEASIMFWSQV